MMKIRKIINEHKIKLVFAVFTIFICIFSLDISFSRFYTEGTFSASTTIYFMSFAPIVNDNGEFTQTMNLSNTITNNKELGPGASGQFNIKIDFSKIDPSVDYVIDVDRTYLPNNLKFYTDSGYSTSFSTITDTHLKDNPNDTVTYTIYWKWEYKTDAASNANDSLFMNSEINLPFSVSFYQKGDQ